ncbi:hypothetical protein [Legionella gresilensis]|uniref:hypothetical protein n=1 Tax=Legionella gresilensis TaxID=91823 RepID=UPI0010412E9D|nr:hypothetical protein [Legionella gresilensis]
MTLKFFSLKFFILQIKFIYFLIKNRKSAHFWLSHSNFSHFPTLLASGFRLNRIILDTVELPDPKHRTCTRIRSYNFLIRYFYRYTDRWIGKRCYKVITTSHSMKQILEKHYGRTVDFITNFDRDYLIPNTIKEPFSIAIPGSISAPTGLNFIASVIPYVPDKWTIKFIGQNKHEINAIKKRIGHKNNVKFYQKTTREKYLNILSTCTVGWILFDVSIKNCLHCLPNRYLDMKKFDLHVIHTGNLGILHYQLKNDFLTPYNNRNKLLEITSKIFHSQIKVNPFYNDSEDWDIYFNNNLSRGQKINIVSFTNIEEKYRIEKVLFGLTKNENKYCVFYKNNNSFLIYQT